MAVKTFSNNLLLCLAKVFLLDLARGYKVVEKLKPHYQVFVAISRDENDHYQEQGYLEASDKP